MALTAARPHRTPRLRAGSRGLACERHHPHLAFGPAGLGLGPAGLHGLGHTPCLRDVAVCFCQTPAIHARRPVPASGCHVTSPPPLGDGRRQQEPRTGCDLEQTTQRLLERGGPRPSPASPRLRSRPLSRSLCLCRWPQGGTQSIPLPPQLCRERCSDWIMKCQKKPWQIDFHP